MPNIVINTGNPTVADVDGTIVEWSSAATVTAEGNYTINVVENDTPILTMSIFDIVSIDGAKTYGNAGDVVLQITNESVTPSQSYSVYTALLTQTGTDAPLATVLENTLGGTVVWTRQSPGRYIGTLAGAFTVDKTFISGFTNWAGDASVYIPISETSSVIGYYTVYPSFDGDFLTLEIRDAEFNEIEFSTLFGASKMYFPDIKVYP